MKTRSRIKLLHSFLGLIEKDELSEKDFSELLDKLNILAKKKDRRVVEFLNDLNNVNRVHKAKKDKMKAVGIIVEEFIAKVVAEICVKITRGY
jgi:hypothetical protein